MTEESQSESAKPRAWWKSIGPALITACVVFGPGSLLISSNVGANYGYELVWLLLLTGVLMGTFLTMGARIGVCGGATPCTLAAERLGRPAAAVIGITLCLICGSFQFSNNIAVAFASGAFFPKVSLTLVGTHLSAGGADTDDASLIFTMKSVPSQGELKKDGKRLDVGDAFTQADITAEKISYTHDGMNRCSDGFNFTVKDTLGNETDEETFSITITNADDEPSEDESSEQTAAITVTDADDDSPTVGNQSATVREAASVTVVPWILVGFNAAIVFFLFTARQLYTFLERVMKVMVGVILACFVFNLIAAFLHAEAGTLNDVLKGFWPSVPEGIELGLPKKVEGAIKDPWFLVAGLLGTTFSVAGALFQGNLVRERDWTVKDYEGSVGDAITGVCVLTGVSMIIMITAGMVIRGEPATNIGTLALSLKPLLGITAFWVFCIGLVAVAMNPFLINAMIGGTILADGIGVPARMSDRWPRVLTVIVMLLGMGIALLALRTGEKPVNLIIFGQALTVLGNPLMAITMLWLANRKDVMGDRRNGPIANILGFVGLLVVCLMAARVLWRVVLQFS